MFSTCLNRRRLDIWQPLAAGIAVVRTLFDRKDLAIWEREEKKSGLHKGCQVRIADAMTRSRRLRLCLAARENWRQGLDRILDRFGFIDPTPKQMEGRMRLLEKDIFFVADVGY